MWSITAMWFFEMADIPSAAFIFDDNLATELVNTEIGSAHLPGCHLTENFLSLMTT